MSIISSEKNEKVRKKIRKRKKKDESILDGLRLQWSHIIRNVGLYDKKMSKLTTNVYGNAIEELV